MSALQIFEFETEPVRAVEMLGETWFVGADVCRCLGISKHRDALASLDDDERRPVKVDTTSGNCHARRTQEMTAVSEPGIYRLVFRSKKPAAERFKRWLAHEVIPQIRRTGKFSTGGRSDVQPFETEDLDELRSALSLVREYRILWGRKAARALAETIPILPSIDDLQIEHAASPDDVQMFFDEATTPEPGVRVQAMQAYAAYVAWCGDSERSPVSMTRFGRRARAIGIEKATVAGRVMYLGVAL